MPTDEEFTMLTRLTHPQQIKPRWRRAICSALKRRYGPSDLPYVYEDLGQCIVKATDGETGAFVIMDFGTFHNAKVIETRGPTPNFVDLP
jgi:hypothetical protein